jgi:diaminohydroxyphosphoribosylaminopyrimidine deaminase/5-amino-6-(5-phosphoribosylamino)uracil reductase
MTSQDDERWMALAVSQAHECPPSENAYSVGAVIVAADGTELARGYSRETDPHVHAEESALAKLAGPGDARLEGTGLRGATIYSTLEPCSQRKSRPRSCTRLIIAAGIGRVVIAWREPSLFVADCQGHKLLEQAGLTVVELPEFAERAMAPNRHLPLLPGFLLAGADRDWAATGPRSSRSGSW